MAKSEAVGKRPTTTTGIKNIYALKSIQKRRHGKKKKTPSQRIGPKNFCRIGRRAGVVRASSHQVRDHELQEMKKDIIGVLRIACALADNDRKKGITPQMMKHAFLQYNGLLILG